MKNMKKNLKGRKPSAANYANGVKGNPKARLTSPFFFLHALHVIHGGNKHNLRKGITHGYGNNDQV